MPEEGKLDSKVGRSTSGSPRRSLRGFIQEARQSASKKNMPIMEAPLLNDPYQKTGEMKNVSRKQTAYCFVPGENHFSLWDPYYPERPERSAVVNNSIITVYPRLKRITPNSNYMVDIDNSEMIQLVHTYAHYLNVREMCEESEEETAQLFDSIYFNGEESFYAAIEAAKMTLSMAKLVAEGTVQNGFANVRPPGHHATEDLPNGYCLFNNVAIAAKYLLTENLVDRILIVDYDVHHGQGTQRIFYDTNQVLYFSIHRFENGTFWPNLEESNFHFIGRGKGLGYNINVPLNETGLTDYDYLTIVTNVLLPVAYEYNPSIILVSAGYDACIGCPEGRMNVSPAFYAHLITLLGGLAGGKLLAVLEGGYFLPSLAEASLKTVQALLNDPCPPLEYHKAISRSVMDSINNVKIALRPYWKCFSQVDRVADIPDIVKFDRYNNHVAVVKFFGKVEEPPFPTRGCYPENTFMKHGMYEYKVNVLKEAYRFHPNRVGFMVNPEASLHNPPSDQRAQEVQMRLTDIMDKLSAYDLIQAMVAVEFDTFVHTDEGCFPGNWVEVSQAILKTHKKEYIDQLKEAALEQKPDLYLNQQTKMVCQHSCAILCHLAREIKHEAISHAVGIVRPPGHHAKCDQANGFCLINNVVVTANYALARLRMNRILIVDFDVHHGDGTQQLTYNRNDIMYISVHRFDNAKFFPKDPSGNFMYIGEGAAAGYNVNIPFENAKMGNADYLYTWLKVVVPMSYAFKPDLILVSAGFDAGINDPLGCYNVHPDLFGHLVQLIKPIAPVILALEGGYNLETTSLSMVNCVRALLGDPLPMPTLENIQKEAATAMANTIEVLKPLWPIMEVNKVLDPNIRFQKDIDEATKLVEKIEEINLG